MKAIVTQKLSPTYMLGTRIKATDGDGNSVTVPYHYQDSGDRNHARAAGALCKKLGWSGLLRRGHNAHRR